MSNVPLCQNNFYQEEKDAVADCLDSGWVNSGGPYSKEFRRQLGVYNGFTINPEKHVALCNSGTSALTLTLKAIGLGKKRTKVLMPTITFAATANAIINAGGEPIFFPVDEHLCLDTEAVDIYLKSHNTKNIFGILPVHVFGNIANMSHFKVLANKYGLYLIEDACEALGSIDTDGRPAGTIGDVGVYSFSFNKIISTGNGGAVISSRPEIIHNVEHFASQCKFDTVNYIHDEVGFQMGMTDVTASIGTVQMKRLEYNIEQKTRIFNKYNELLGAENIIQPPINTLRPNHWFVGLKTKLSYSFGAVEELKKEDIQTRPLWRSLHTQKPYEQYEAYQLTSNPSYKMNVMNLPCSVDLQDEQISEIATKILGLGVVY